MALRSDLTSSPSNDRTTVRVRDVLAMTTVQRGEPRVLTDSIGLETPVRWVHVASDANVAHLLSGGELLLTTAAGWPETVRDVLTEVNRLLDADISGLIIELGKRFDQLPVELVQLCTQRGVSLVALERETSFVGITEQVHRAILNEQSEALAARDNVQAMLTTLGLNRAPVDFVVEQLGAELRTAVVLENTLGEVISWSGSHPGDDPSTLLAHWPRTSVALDEGWDAVPVAARDVRWGQLIALPGPPHPAGRQTVLELGAVALALGRLADPFERADRWMSTNAKRLLEDLLEGRYRSESAIAAQLKAAGMPLDTNHVRAFALRTERDPVEVLAALHESLRGVAKVIVAPAAEIGAPTMGLLAVPQSARHAHQFDQLQRALGRSFDSSLEKSGRSPRVLLTLGSEASTVSELVTSIETALTLHDAAPTFSGAHVTLSVVETQPLAMLVSELKHDERLTRFAQRVLSPLQSYDTEHNADLVRVLSAYLRHPTNRSQAAQAANLSRSVFYQRLELIERVLDVELTDGTTLATLTLALHAAPHLVTKT